MPEAKRSTAFNSSARGGCVWQDSLSASDCRAGKFLQFFAGKRACVMAMEARSSAHYPARELALTPGKHRASTEASDALSHGLRRKRPITVLRALDSAT